MRIILPDISPWRHDLCGCLHNCLGTMLLQQHVDPTTVLGAAWNFSYVPGDVRREEYYYPCRSTSIVQSIAPYHAATSCWHEPPDTQAGWDEIKHAIEQGKPAIVAVDNYYLPFRPAFQDVHSNHLILVYGFDDEYDYAYVLDVTPPAFRGPLARTLLQQARSSQNEARHARDLFFTNVPIAQRWLEVDFQVPYPSLEREWLRSVLVENINHMRSASEEHSFIGIAGIASYYAYFMQGITDNNNPLFYMDELFMVSYILMETTALHADFLALAGRKLSLPRLTELSRWVDTIAHHYTALRIMAAKGRNAAVEMLPRIARRCEMTLIEHEKVLSEIELLLRYEI